jgi:hypothetical protein
MLPARFRILERWLLRSRRFRRGPALILVLVSVGSANAPVRFPNSFQKLSKTEIASPARDDVSKPAPRSVSLLDSAEVFDLPAESLWPVPQWPIFPISDYPFPIESWPNLQSTSDGQGSLSAIEPDTTPAIDLPADPTIVSVAGLDFSSGNVSAPASNPVEPVKPIAPGTPVPEPAQFCFIALVSLALRRIR